ncbi:MAG: hypothetical protein A2103_05605 [Gammaproteobacteria bacterium GWF2_41_13]|nr:MAG: hypothetical protein A2103_05605 [Gammaproteobacteria bacterium GWF2_41_13]
MKKHLQQMADYLLPHTCCFCQKKTHRSFELCPPCESQLPRIKQACTVCGKITPYHFPICVSCLKNPPPFDRTYVLFPYESLAARMITRLKFGYELRYAKILGQLMAHYLIDTWSREPSVEKPECIIPIPLHLKRLKERGFNQSVEIARPIQKRLHIPIELYAGHRMRYTQAQSSLPQAERKKNVAKAFATHKNFRANHVAILDDVMTTGYTVSEFSRALRKKGVQKIDVWCCARA